MSDNIDFSEYPEDDLNEILADLERANLEAEKLYVPHPKQKLFHCATNTIRAALGGNRSGKSEMGSNEARFHATGKYPTWYPESKRWMKATRGRIICSDYRVAAKEVIEPKLKQWFFPEEILRIDRTMGNITKVHVQHITGGVSTFDVLTHEQSTTQFEGWNGHWVWFDEPPPRDKYIASLRGLVDFQGRAWITATPIAEPWLFDELFHNPKQDTWTIAVSTYDNPYLTPEGRNILLASLSPEEEEARIHGKFLHLTGRVYNELDTDIHLLESLPKGYEKWPTYFVLDPADRRPHHGIWAKVDPFGTVYIIDELVFKGTIKDTCKQILMREVTYKINPLNVIRILDPNKGNTPTAVTGLKLIDEFASHAVYFTANVNDDVALGHLAVKERLSYDKRVPASSTNHPKLYFLRDKTRECIKQMLSYVWDDWRGANNAGKSQKEKPKDINKDMPDCVRYLCMSNPVWFQEEDSDGLNPTPRFR